MKKILLSMAVLMAAAFTMNAQLSYSVNVGYANRATTSTLTAGDTKTITKDAMGGFNLGVMASYELMTNVAVNAGLQFDFAANTEKDEFFGIETKVRTLAKDIEIPVRASYMLDLGEAAVFAYAGPAFEFGLVNKSVTTIDETSTTLNAYGEDGVLNRFNILAGAGVGVLYHDLFLNVGYDFGLLDLDKNDNSSLRTSELKVGLGIKF
ncbi:MAG: PorT family protein [Bacteroidales bacterium]|nr:PorT family protein [Bacteroidales bacterium]MBQ5604476.1 PorT family protein [Bacteroidales bacterium]MBR0453149.1 PorT family protein [Bacteroidales bacterium]